MSVSITTEMRVHRVLRNLDRFSRCNDPALYSEEMGRTIGVYDNTGGSHSQDEILICDHGLVVGSAGAASNLFFEQILEVIGPPSTNLDREELTKILVIFKDQSHPPYKLYVEGGNGKVYDSFAFLRFVSRVLEDRAENV